MIELMKPKYTFTQSEIQDGDIICFQVDISDKEIHDLESQGLYSNPPQFYDFLQNRVMVLFRPKFDEPDTEQPEFSLVLSKKQNYDAVSLPPSPTDFVFFTYLRQMASKVGEYLKHEAIKLRFTTTHAANGTPKSILKRSLNQSITEIISPSYVVPSTTVILYEKLDVSIVELETKRSLKVVWTGINNKEESTHPFLLPKTSMVHDLSEHLSKQVQLTPTGTGRIRVFEVAKDGRTQKEFTGSEMIGNIPDPVELFAEEIPREEVDAEDHDKVINIFHFTRDVARTHGVPFKFVVKPVSFEAFSPPSTSVNWFHLSKNEPFSETKKRLQHRLGVPDKDFSRFKFALIQSATFKQPSYIEDGSYAPLDPRFQLIRISLR